MLRQRVTTDIATKGGQFDVLTIGTYEVPIWAKKSWLVPLDKLGADYDVDDLLPAIRSGLSFDGKLYAAPFYGESSMVMYRKDLFDKAGLKMPDSPTWDFIARRGRARSPTEQGRRLRHLPARQGRLGREHGLPDRHVQLLRRALVRRSGSRSSTKPWKDTLNFYVNLMKDAGPPGASSNGFNENLALFNAGKCGMWIDATVAASFVTDPKQSKVADKVGFALAPDNGLGKSGNWLWAWSLAIPAGSKKADAAQKFIAWATCKDYTELVASKEGWANVPPGTRTSLYNNPEYQKAAPFAEDDARTRSTRPTRRIRRSKPVPYTGVQFVAIPEFQGLGTEVGQLFSAALAGTRSVDDALAQAQTAADREMKKAGYIK